MKNISKYYKHVIIFLLLSIGLSIAIDSFFKHQKENYLTIQTDLLKTQYETQYKYLKIMSFDIFSMYQDKPALIALFAKANDANNSSRAVIRDKM